jgi:hypothetical protein
MGTSDNDEPVHPSWNPLKCSATGLPVNLTVLVKSLAAVVLLTNHVKILPDPWLPFIPSLALIPPVFFQRTLQTAFVLSALAILFNRKIRIASVVLGSTMLLAVVSSKAYYGNNKTFCGLMFLLAGLYKPGGPNFIRWQLAITYFGAGLNKLLDADWQSGVFFENWAVNRLHQPWYIALNSRLPALSLARFMCWTTIATELGIVPCLFIPRLYYWAALLNVLFQASLLLFTGTTFTLFFYSMTAASLALVNWPVLPVTVLYDPGHGFGQRARKLLQFWDLDGNFHWIPSQSVWSRTGLYLSDGEKTYSGFRALRMIVLLNPITYLAIAASIAVAGDMADWAMLYRRVIVATCLVLLLSPLAWFVDLLFHDVNQQAPNIASNLDSRRPAT